ncbi:MAG: RDD family protein [Candidatus Angelobacter sp.]
MPENFIFCSKCGAQNAGMAQFCQNCGLGLSSGLAPVQAAAPARAYAPAPPVAYTAVPASPYGGFWIRLLAHLIDHVILGAVAAPLFFIMVLPAALRVVHEAERNQEPSPELIFAILSSVFIYVALAFAGQWLYEALLTSSSWQGTIGKRVLRLKVVDEAGNRISFGRATGRFFAKILSSMFFCIGFLMIAFTERKCGLHDMLAGTMVVRY